MLSYTESSVMQTVFLFSDGFFGFLLVSGDFGFGRMRISDKLLVAPLLPGALTVGDLLGLVEDSVCSPLGSDVGWLVAP